MKLFFILGNQLFPLKNLDRFKKDHVFFMAEDNGLCTYEKHHKQKILLFLSSMRSYADKLRNDKFKLVYSGQHYSKNMSDVFLKKFKIRNISYNLRLGKKNNSKNFMNNFFIRFQKILKKEKYGRRLRQIVKPFF